MTAEEWRPVVGFDGYLVSDQGRVASLHKWKGQPGPRILRGYKAPFGYPCVHLAGASTGSRNRKARSIHSLVAEAFIGPRPIGQEVRHLDGDPTNCRVDNLAYGTKQENEADKVRHGTDRGSVTHCVNGHEFNEANTHIDPRLGRRFCRACTRENSRRYRINRALRAAGIAA